MNAIKTGQKIETMVADYCEIDIERPGGVVETIRNPNSYRELNAALFARFVQATAAAGKGKVLAYRNIKKAAAYTVTAADAATDSTARIERAMRAGE